MEDHDAVKALDDGETILHWVKECLESPCQTIFLRKSFCRDIDLEIYNNLLNT